MPKKKQEVPAPVEQPATTPSELIGEFHKIGEFIERESKRFNEFCKPHQVRQEEIRQILHADLLALNEGQPEGKRASFSTANGTAYLSTISTPKVVDKTQYLDWILDNWDEWGSMLQIGAPQKATLDDYLDENENLPPFIQIDKFIRVNIKKS